MELEKFYSSIQTIIDSQADQPERFNYRLGLKLEAAETDPISITLGFDAGEWCLNPFGDVHGGVVASILDTSMGIGSAALCGTSVNTTDMSVSYLSALKGEHFHIHCEYTKVGRRMIRSMARITDDNGKIYATAMGSFMVLGNEKTIG